MTRFRMLYRPTGRNFWTYGWVFAHESQAAATRLLNEFNRRDRGRIEWRVDTVLPTDIDA